MQGLLCLAAFWQFFPLIGNLLSATGKAVFGKLKERSGRTDPEVLTQVEPIPCLPPRCAGMVLHASALSNTLEKGAQGRCKEPLCF